MTTRSVAFAPDEYYHVYNRGTDKRVIFNILIKAKDDLGVSTFMNKLGTSYSMYFNKRYERTGSLFGGRFKSEHVNTDEYLKYLFSYIHLNPVKLIQKNWKEQGIENSHTTFEYLRGFEYSSLPEYLGVQRSVSEILHTSVFPEYFACSGEYQTELLEWLTFKPEP